MKEQNVLEKIMAELNVSTMEELSAFVHDPNNQENPLVKELQQLIDEYVKRKPKPKPYGKV